MRIILFEYLVLNGFCFIVEIEINYGAFGIRNAALSSMKTTIFGREFFAITRPVVKNIRTKVSRQNIIKMTTKGTPRMFFCDVGFYTWAKNTNEKSYGKHLDNLKMYWYLYIFCLRCTIMSAWHTVFFKIR